MLFLLLFVFWIILNGNITGEILLFGLAISLVVYKFAYKSTRLTSSLERKAVSKLISIIEYLAILVFEVYKANVEIIKQVLSPNPEIKPALKYFRADLKSRISLVALANSITLTPGTITVTMNEDELLIHALKVEYLDGIEESIFVEKLKKLEE